MAVQPRLKPTLVPTPNALFPNNLTPSRDYLVRTVRRGIRDRTLRTTDLMLLIVHLREIGFDDVFFEWGSSVAHTRRNRGVLWKSAVDIWATHVYFSTVDWNNIDLRKLPIPLFEMFFWILDFLTNWQFRNDFIDLYPQEITRDEAKQTLNYLYGAPRQKDRRRPDEQSGFVLLVNEKTSDARDLAFVRRLIRLCEIDALNMTPKPMSGYVDLFERALRQLGAVPWKLDDEERTYLQLHFLICLHNTIIDLDYDFLGSVVAEPATPCGAMLSASAMGRNLSLDMAFYFRKDDGSLEQVDLESGDKRYPNLTYPIITTDLSEYEFLLESDDNILACLYNHPLAVKMYRGQPRLIALDRTNCVFPVTRDRTKPRLPRPNSIEDLVGTFTPS